MAILSQIRPPFIALIAVFYQLKLPKLRSLRLETCSPSPAVQNVWVSESSSRAPYPQEKSPQAQQLARRWGPIEIAGSSEPKCDNQRVLRNSTNREARGAAGGPRGARWGRERTRRASGVPKCRGGKYGFPWPGDDNSCFRRACTWGLFGTFISGCVLRFSQHLASKLAEPRSPRSLSPRDTAGAARFTESVVCLISRAFGSPSGRGHQVPRISSIHLP